MKKHFIYLFIVVCSACRESHTTIDSFDTVEKVASYDSLYSDKNEPFGMITNLEIVDGILITEHMNDEYNYSFIDVDNGKLLRRWGRIGDAPGEYLDFGSDFTVSKSQLVFLSKMKKEINFVPISELLENKDTLRTTEEAYPYTVDFRPGRFVLVNNRKIFLGSFKQGRLGLLNSANEIEACLFDYPFDCGEVSGIYRGSVFQGKMKSNSKQGKFVVLTFSSDIFEIYTVGESGLNRTYVSPFKHIPQVWKKADRYTINDDESIAGLMNIAVSDEFICFTYSAQSYNEIVSLNKGSNEVLCFDWEGKKIKKYILPFPIHNLCLDENYIYGVRNDMDDTVIYRFKI